MEVNFTFNFWDNVFSITSIIVSSLIAFWIYKLSKKLSARDKYEYELRVTREIRKIKIYSSVILADVSKYRPLIKDQVNKGYYKQGAELYTIVPGHGVLFILNPSDERIPIGLVPFEWIEFVRESDSEYNKPIVVCKFKGIKWYRNFKSPFKEIRYYYKNPDYRDGIDPEFMMLTPFKPKNLSKRS